MNQHDPSNKPAANESAANKPTNPAPCGGCGAGASENRRGFLFAAGTTLLTIGGALAAVPIVGAALAPAANRNPNKWLPLAKTDTFVPGDTVYLSGFVADDPKLSIQDQTRQVLGKIDQHLAMAKTDKSRLLTAQICLADITMWADMNTIWDAWVVPGQTPARATVQAKLAGPTHLIEIMVVAAR